MPHPNGRGRFRLDSEEDMNKEKRLINIINDALPANPFSLNKCFESDAEVIMMNGNSFLFSVDGFSSEDMLCENDPFRLGWNMAVGAMSDILACGGTPLFYAHDMSVCSTWDDTFIERLSQGVSHALKASKTMFIGGDFGKTKEWKYTACVIGQLHEKPLLRKGAMDGDSIYLSGKVGAGNFNAALNIFSDERRINGVSKILSSKFQLRLSESALIREFASCCIDTSDGVFNALNIISELNGTGYYIDNLPYIKKGKLMAKILSLPEILLFFGGCGEYELLFNIRRENEEEFKNQVKKSGFKFYRLGRITSGKPLRKIVMEKGKSFDLSKVKIDPRDFDNVKEYLRNFVRIIEGLDFSA
jgi:thiamine-monophosphate kinase